MAFVPVAKTTCVTIAADVLPPVKELPDNYPSLEEKLEPMIAAGLTTGKVLNPTPNTSIRLWLSLEAAQEWADYIQVFPETISATAELI